MPPRRRTRPAPLDIDALRLALSRGKIVRVGVAPSDQFPEGLTGRVRRIGNPVVDGEEFLFVEVPVGGVKDVLPFAPADLTAPPARTRTLRVAGDPVSARVSDADGATGEDSSQEQLALRPESESIPWPTAARTARAAHARTRNEVTALHDDAPPRTAGSTTAPRPSIRSRTQQGDPAPIPGEPSRERRGAAPRGKRAPVIITISTAGDESAVWQIEARIGTRTAVKPTIVPPSRVWEIVESLGDPKLTDLMQSLLTEHRRLAQARADSLTAELSALQEQLKGYPAGDS